LECENPWRGPIWQAHREIPQYDATGVPRLAPAAANIYPWRRYAEVWGLAQVAATAGGAGRRAILAVAAIDPVAEEHNNSASDPKGSRLLRVRRKFIVVA
jgi:hypothetical protein